LIRLKGAIYDEAVKDILSKVGYGKNEEVIKKKNIITPMIFQI